MSISWLLTNLFAALLLPFLNGLLLLVAGRWVWARLSAQLLQSEGLSRVLLVTHAWHMPRALESFSATGLSVFPAPTVFYRASLTVLDFLPSGYNASRLGLHEWIGQLWYRLRGRSQ